MREDIKIAHQKSQGEVPVKKVNYLEELDFEHQHRILCTLVNEKHWDEVSKQN